MKNLLLFLGVFVIAACTSVAKKMYSVKNPKFESHQSQLKFLKENSVEYTKTFHYKNFQSYIEASQKIKIGIPDAFFFNNKGEFVSYKKSPKDCNANVFGFIKDIKNFKNLQSSDSIHLDEIVSLTTIDSSALSKQSEITVILTWAVFAGKVNDEKTFKWIELLKQAQKDNVDLTYYLVNCDLQDSWNLNEKQKNVIAKKLKI